MKIKRISLLVSAILMVLTINAISLPKKNVTNDESVVYINITNKYYVDWNDKTDTYGWWLISGNNETYYAALSTADNTNSSAPGEYEFKDLDNDWTFVRPLASTDPLDPLKGKIYFVSGSCVVVIEDNGDVIIDGTFLGEDNKTYVLHFERLIPTVEEKKDITISNAQYADFPSEHMFVVEGIDANVDIWLYFSYEESADITSFTENNIDLSLSRVNNDDYYAFRIYSVDNLNVVDNNNGTYTIIGAILCYSGVLYNITITFGEALEAIYNIQDSSSKAQKVLSNGQALILKGEKVYTLQGQEVR